MDRNISGKASAVYLISAFFFLSIILVLWHRQISGFATRTALFVRVSLDGGSLIVPHLYGRPYADYPPLFFLFQYLSSLPAGHATALSISLPSAASASALILLTWWFSTRHLGSRTAIVSALCIASLPEFWLKAEKAVIDMLLALECSMAMVCFYQAERSKNHTYSNLLNLAGYGAVIAGLFTKGPVGMLLPMFCWLLYLAALKRFRDILKILPLYLIICVTGFSMAALMFWKTGGVQFLHEAFYNQFLSRLGGPANKPVYYYFFYLVLSFLPWLLWLGAYCLIVWKNGTRPDKTDPKIPASGRRFSILLLTWSAGVLAPFLMSASRHGRYILPAFMPLSILIGSAISALSGKLDLMVSARSVKFLLCAYVLSSILLLAALIMDPLDSGRHIVSFALITFMAFGCMYAGRRLDTGLKAALIFAVLLIYSTSAACLVIEPGLSKRESAADFVKCTEKELSPGEKVVLFKIRPDKNGIKYALFSKAYPERLLFIDKQEILQTIPSPFVLAAFSKDIDLSSPFLAGYSVESLCRGSIHRKRVISIRLKLSKK